ncbi:hypothetical protein [Paractinoplanes lichenicola]|uniref:Uncharacterized protein n=1 Tax=Paractinoplanes lichenicola TaxID=2802976 RepID=A0ABS1W322_9ACTN|nr:hypothetical protein [Actinoplanes lichenicola]MBL7261112.1 hypothetical protein [Actinoplanes lichenicola]
MTQHIRELLDHAVAGIEPGTRDPVAAVMGRRRAARRRKAVAGAVACVLAAAGIAGGLALNRHDANGPMAPVGSVPVEPPTPRVVDRVVVAGAMRLPVPDGWRVATPGSDSPCGRAGDGQVLIYGETSDDCARSSIRVSTAKVLAYPVGSLEDLPGGSGIMTPLPLLTLPGGEPALLRDAFETGHTSMVLPWSKVILEFNLDGPAARTIAGTIRTEPVGSGRLNLVDSVPYAEFSRPEASGKFTVASHGKITDPATIAEVLALLRDQRKAVSGEDACSQPGDRAALLLLGNASVVYLTIDKDCQEAFSDRGGRVRLSDKAVRELTRLFGIEVR